MSEAPSPVAITIRPALPEDAEGIARTFLESAEYHAGLEPARYQVPDVKTILARYQNGQQHPSDSSEESITLVAELSGEIVGFVDVGLGRSPDPMHRDIVYCHTAEIAVSSRHQKQGIGEKLLLAAEVWGRSKGAAFASLEYHVANTRAAKFYQRRMGYSVAAFIAIKRL